MEPGQFVFFWRNARAGWFNFNWNGVITPNSVVHISACKCIFPEGNIFGSEGIIRRRDAAPVWVKNIRPHGPNPGNSTTGGVEFYLQIDWNTPLNIAVDITVLGGPEDRTIV